MSNNDIVKAIGELVTCLGVKEETPSQNLLALLRKKDVQGCVQQIASRLGLPIQIGLSYVSKDFKPGCANRFQSQDLARTDWTGRGIEGITAQVAIPEHLPMYGSSALEGYTIQVRVSENARESPATFIAIMAHELSHVLLRSLIHPQKDSELHTDLVPILLGFGDLVQRGRKTIESTTSSDVTTTRTTTYGYLTDYQFRVACEKVRAMLEGYQRDKKRLLKQVLQVRRKLDRATRRSARFRDYLQHLDKHPKKRTRRDDAAVLVQFHALEYTREWEIGITQAKTTLCDAETFVRPLSHYTNLAVQKIKDYTRSLELASKKLGQLIEAITGDLKIVRRYVGLPYRLRKILSLRSQSDRTKTTD